MIGTTPAIRHPVSMSLIGLALWMTVASLVAPFDSLAGEGAKRWYLLEPPVDETSDFAYGVLDQAPLTKWTRIATMTLRLHVSTNETKRSKRAGMKQYVCRRHRPCQILRYSEELTATVASPALVPVSLQMTLD